ncbi:hypothetical protein HAX54_022356 [Datura stramonium]|uniref:Uncharacterized protein n=1 Tax=Datura stramonium TaxID=4076 RepID=A0ABS8S6L4_DATST|nr:hypothetical protein [Datura stramonium]
MVDRLHTLGLGFVFDALGDCNLNMFREFLAYWMPKDRSNQLQQLNMDYHLREHSRALCKVGPGFKEPLDDDVATDDEMVRVDSDIESSDDNEEDSEIGEATLTPTGDEE